MDHELIDAGEGMRLERFGDRIVARPHPGADGRRADTAAWRAADLSYDRDTGWRGRATPWIIAIDDLTVELRPTAAGQIGLFPEQQESWSWLGGVARLRTAPRVLNLFAYTGAATLALAAAGASVTHVDAARPTVAWARRNAELSGLAAHPIRWIVDDARAFVAREIRRRQRYDGIVLDPPSYGHGRAGRAWRIDTDLPELLRGCATLVDRERGFVLLTAHTPGHGPSRLADGLAAALGVPSAVVESGELVLRARSGARLRLGAYARWTGVAEPNPRG